MKKLAYALLACSAMLPVIASAAGTCADPIPLASQSSPSGTTLGGEFGINMGGTIYQHAVIVYKFHINSAGPGGTPTTIGLTGTDREASVVTSCNDDGSMGPAPENVLIAAALPPADVSGLANGDYLLVVSTDPSLAVTDPPRGGAYTVNAGVLPVALQNFSVE